jgi:hypothetical protein
MMSCSGKTEFCVRCDADGVYAELGITLGLKMIEQHFQE